MMCRATDNPVARLPEALPQLLHLTGTPRERGIQHGRHIGDTLVAYWAELLKDVGERAERPMTEAQLRTWIRSFAQKAEAAVPHLAEEVRGIAEGAGVPHETALAVTFGEEIGHLASSLGCRSASASSQRCLSIVIPAAKSATGSAILAQTWDGPDWTPPPLLFAVEEENGSQVFLADPGWVGGVGVNSRGLGSVHTGVLIKGSPAGLPYPFLVRRILEASCLADGVAAAVDVSSTAGCHYIVCANDEVVDVESAGAVKAVLRCDGDYLSTCAHFSDTRCIAEQTRPNDPVSMHRVARLLHLAEEGSTWAPLDVFELLADHAPGPEGLCVCLHPGPGRSLASIVMDPSAKRLWAKIGNPCGSAAILEVAVVGSGFETTPRDAATV